MFYNQAEHDKRRMSHDELSSSEDESIEDEEEEENIDNDVSKFVEEGMAKAMAILGAEARAKLPDYHL